LYLARKVIACRFSPIFARVSTEASDDTINPLFKEQFLYTPDNKKLLVLIPGLSESTKSLQFVAQKFHEKGYNVWMPRLPGHGVIDPTNSGANNPSLIPCARNYLAWKEYTKEIAEILNMVTENIHIVGFSAGGAIAAYLATLITEKPKERLNLTLLAPFFNPAKRGERIGLSVLRFLDYITFGLVGRILDKIPHPVSRTIPESQTPDFSLGQILSFNKFANLVGSPVAEQLKCLSFFMGLVKDDDRICEPDALDFFNRVPADTPKGHYVFKALDGEPALVHPGLFCPDYSTELAVSRRFSKFLALYDLEAVMLI
jgi:hypothetical protein